MAVTVTPKGNLSYRVVKLASTTASANINVTEGPTTVYSITIVNASSTPVSTCFHDGTFSTTAAVGTTDPTMIITVPNAGTNTVAIPEGLAFATAINIWTKQQAGTAGTTAPAGGTVTVYLTTGV